MINHVNDNFFITVFPILKLKDDLFWYLDQIYSDCLLSDKSYNIDVPCIEEAENCRIVNIDRTDVLTITKFEYHFHVLSNSIYFYVEAGIGEFQTNDKYPYMFSVSKCIALFKYNYDLTLFDLSLYTSKMNE